MEVWDDQTEFQTQEKAGVPLFNNSTKFNGIDFQRRKSLGTIAVISEIWK